jgi:hypothetical protein
MINLYRNMPGFLRQSVVIIIALAVLGAGFRWVYPWAIAKYSGVVNAPLTFNNSIALSEREFEKLALDLTKNHRQERADKITADEDIPFAKRLRQQRVMNLRSVKANAPFPHIDYFRKAGIRQYEGPSTCLRCHEKMDVPDGKGGHKKASTLDDVVGTVHFKFQQSESGFSTYGFDGREVNGEGTRPIPMGKINRACGVPGSFSWTGWADLVKTKPAHSGGEIEIRSEGCGQCHIGGGYHPATEMMLPGGRVPNVVKQGIDCLICHAPSYDMNQRFVVEDEHGQRWNQDRSMKAAMTVGLPNAKTCMTCHQHNMGGDLEKDLPAGAAPDNLGYKNKRLLHPGSKRGNSMTAEHDVHMAAGMSCTDCHVPEGHKIPRGTKGVDLIANDLPGKVVACETCHTTAPHSKDTEDRAILNGHGARVSCEACHIKSLRDDNVVLRDWVHPIWNEEEGVYIFKDIYQSGKAGQGFTFLWFNGNGTFLANALGNNPNGGEAYNPLMDQMVTIDDPEAIEEIRAAAIELKESYPDLDVEKYVQEATNPLSTLSPEMLAKRKKMIEENIRPVMEKGESKLYPFKIFNAIMYEDMNNQGPFGAMILPFDYPSYYEGGNAKASVKEALKNPIVKRMYETPFKLYMMDEFMKYFGVEKWTGEYPLENDQLKNVESHWMRQMGTLMINHGIQRTGRKCKHCHSNRGVVNFEALGYPQERAKELRNLPELD